MRAVRFDHYGDRDVLYVADVEVPAPSAGEVVVKDGEVVSNGHKKTVWVNVNMPENLQVKRDITQSFTKDYTVQLENYSVRDYLAPHPYVINVDVEA